MREFFLFPPPPFFSFSPFFFFPPSSHFSNARILSPPLFFFFSPFTFSHSSSPSSLLPLKAAERRGEERESGNATPSLVPLHLLRDQGPELLSFSRSRASQGLSPSAGDLRGFCSPEGGSARWVWLIQVRLGFAFGAVSDRRNRLFLGIPFLGVACLLLAVGGLAEVALDASKCLLVDRGEARSTGGRGWAVSVLFSVGSVLICRRLCWRSGSSSFRCDLLSLLSCARG